MASSSSSSMSSSSTAFGTLYTHKLTPRSAAILAIAKAHGLELNIVYAEDQENNQENHAKLLEINPLGQIPVFVGRDGYVLTECIPIALYITSQNDSTTLLGSCRRDYYDIIRWMSMANSDLVPAIGGVILPLLNRPLKVRKNRNDCLRALQIHLQLIESHLKLQHQHQHQQEGQEHQQEQQEKKEEKEEKEKNEKRNHSYLVGDRGVPTLADFFVVGTLQFAVMVLHKMFTAKYPCVMAWFLDVYKMPLFRDVVGDLHLMDMDVDIDGMMRMDVE